MNVNEYRACMSGRTKGVNEEISKEERKILFSVSAKMCSNKTDKVSNAIAIVMSEHPAWFEKADTTKLSNIASKNKKI